MSYFDRIDVSEGIDVNKISACKEYWYFLNKGFKFRPNVCNRSHDLLRMSINLSDIAILNVKGSNYCGIICEIIKNDAMNIMQNAYFTGKSRPL